MEKETEERRGRFSIKEILLKGITELFVLIFAILFFFVIYKFQDILKAVKVVCGILMPIIVGIGVAYLINPMVVFFERHFWRIFGEKVRTRAERKGKKENPLAFRMPAILLCLLLLLIVVYLLASLVLPQIYGNVRNVIYALPEQINSLMAQVSNLMADDQTVSGIIQKVYKEVADYLTNWVKTDMLSQMTSLVTGVVGVAGAIVDFFVGLIVAVYVLMSKETFKRQGKMLLHAFLDEKKAGKLIEILKESDKIFGGYISGVLVDSLAVGILCFIGAMILQLPYAPLVSVIVGVTNVIPFFGPYIGAVPSAILILLASPTKGIIFILFVVVLQQIDGNLVAPRILGHSTGLSPFWVIFAILLGGGLFGIVGMLIGVPTFGVIYYLAKSFVHYRLAWKETRRETCMEENEIRMDREGNEA